MAEECLKKATSTPIFEYEVDGQQFDEHGGKYTYYIGKAESTKGNITYWLGASLPDFKENHFFDSFEAAFKTAKTANGITKFFDVKKF